MTKLQPSDFYKYDDVNDIHMIDYSGRVDLQTGLSRIAYIKECFQIYQKSGMPLKVLIDARYYQKHSPETHDQLSKIARNTFKQYII